MVYISKRLRSSHDVAADRDQHTIEGNHVLEAVRLLGWDNGTVLLKDLRSELDGKILTYIHCHNPLIISYSVP